MWRAICLLPFCLWLSAGFVAAEVAQDYPLWDGEESVASYANRLGLQPTRNVDVGDGVLLEMVLIPAGRFIMGTPPPQNKPDLGSMCEQKLIGVYCFLAGAVSLLLLTVRAIVRTGRGKRRIRFSLSRLVLMALAGSVAFLGALHWWTYTDRMARAEGQYQTELARWMGANSCESVIGETVIPRPFYLAKYELTQEQYLSAGNWNLSGFSGLRRPADNLRATDVGFLCEDLTARTRLPFRAPSIAEWEYACRAGTQSRFHAGDDPSALAEAAWYGQNSAKRTHVVGQKAPNRFGLYDMHGNVNERCGEVFYFDHATGLHLQVSDAWLRGGSWLDDEAACRAGYLSRDHGFSGNCVSGFRVAMDVPSKGQPDAELPDETIRRLKARQVVRSVLAEYRPGHVLGSGPLAIRPLEDLESQIRDAGEDCIPVLVAEIDQTKCYELIRFLRVFDSERVPKAIARWLKERRMVPFDSRLDPPQYPHTGTFQSHGGGTGRLIVRSAGNWIHKTGVLLEEAQPYADRTEIWTELLAFLKQRWPKEGSDERVRVFWCRTVTEGARNLSDPFTLEALREVAEMDSICGEEAMGRVWAENARGYRQKALGKLKTGSTGYAFKVLRVLNRCHQNGSVPEEVNVFIAARGGDPRYEEAVRLAREIKALRPVTPRLLTIPMERLAIP